MLSGVSPSGTEKEVTSLASFAVVGAVVFICDGGMDPLRIVLLLVVAAGIGILFVLWSSFAITLSCLPLPPPTKNNTHCL